MSEECEGFICRGGIFRGGGGQRGFVLYPLNDMRHMTTVDTLDYGIGEWL